eukprot:1822529-Pyramimonas_sp.AAC.1
MNSCTGSCSLWATAPRAPKKGSAATSSASFLHLPSRALNEATSSSRGSSRRAASPASSAAAVFFPNAFVSAWSSWPLRSGGRIVVSEPYTEPHRPDRHLGGKRLAYFCASGPLTADFHARNMSCQGGERDEKERGGTRGMDGWTGRDGREGWMEGWSGGGSREEGGERRRGEEVERWRGEERSGPSRDLARR